MTKLNLMIALAALIITPAALHAQHGHLNAGVFDTNGSTTANAGDKLGFKNGNDWVYDFVGNSGYTHPSTVTGLGNQATSYGGTVYQFAITPSALSGDSGKRATINTTTGAVTYSLWESFAASAEGSLAVAGAHAGSFLKLQMVSVELLSGTATSFSFWGNTAAYNPSPTPTLPTTEWTFAGLGLGTRTGTDLIDLSQINTRMGDGTTATYPGTLPITLPSYPNAYDAAAATAGFGWNVDYNGGSPNLATADDPYGHIHGRNFATNGADSAFKLTWKVVDVNGIHPDSDVLTLRWESVPEPASGMLLVSAVTGIAAIARFRRKSRQA